eukprot:TRINITY_DN1587_c0_g2_i2.p1 TRINITY_DN1587_c0_g2~~TRINITY_DN1587_c0_g2_i2.p1  ORF type:complete len:935 (-),score=149.40 TRINITY_DN1587_c0_g2_i2:178-2655(-)
MDWKPLANCHYRKRDTYTMQWEVDLGNLAVVAAPLGGAIAVSRDDTKIVLVTGEDGINPQIQMFTSAGRKLASFAWDPVKGRIIKTGWTADERFLCVLETGTVWVYNVHGEQIGSISFGQEVAQQGVLQCYIWHNGLVILTKRLMFFAISNLMDPRVRQLAVPNLEEPPASWCVVEPDISASRQVEVIVSTLNATIVVITVERALELKFKQQVGPYVRMTVAPTGNILACFTPTGFLQVMKLDFSSLFSEFDTESKKPPQQLVWCGNDAVLLYWPDIGVLMVGPDPDAWIRYAYDEPVHLIPECDGVRIISNKKCEFLQRVPAVTEAIFGIGSTAPAALLYDALVHFEKKSPKADENIRAIKGDLSDAVDACIEAAGHEPAASYQRRLLRAASFGKIFLDSYVADPFVDMCKTLRVLNAVRLNPIGMPLTFQQFKMLTARRLVDRLINRHHHLLAWNICGYLKMKRDNILVHWACCKVQSNLESEREVLSSIVSKLQALPAVSYAEIASTAFRAGKPELATKLLDYEPRAAEQVPLLITMGQEELALSKAILSGDTDLVYLVLLHVRRTRPTPEFFRIIRGKPEAVDLLIAYCKQQDLDLLKEIFYHAQLPNESANIAVIEAYNHNDTEKRIRGLQIAMNLYKDTKDQFAFKATETQNRLLLQQKELQAQLPDVPLIGCPLSETIRRLILARETKAATKLRNEFKVPDKRYWWICIRALAQLGDWGQLEQFANSKKSPIGYRPFAEVCIDEAMPREAAKYILRIVNPRERIDLFLVLQMYREAAEAAMEVRDENPIALLEEIRSKSPDRQDQLYITQLMQSKSSK